MSFYKYFRNNLRFAGMIVTLSFTSVALTAVAYEYTSNPQQFEKELTEARQGFSLVGSSRRIQDESKKN
jgi:hypothetical protein